MKTRDIAGRYCIDRGKFEDWLAQTNYKYTKGLTGINLDDNCDVDKIVAEFVEHQTAEKERASAKKTAMAQMLITSGFSFDGYKIVKYSGYISGDDAIQIERGTAGSLFLKATNAGDALMDSLKIIRRNALKELKEAAYDLGCNAVIGVDFDYITLDPETANTVGGTTYLPYVFGVTANGNAVIIEKEE